MRRFILVAGILSGTVAHADPTADLRTCRDISDSLARLTCYDGVASKLSAPARSAAAIRQVRFVSAELNSQGKDFERSIFQTRVEMRPTFSNQSNKTVVAISHEMAISNAFGDIIVRGEDKLDIRLKPGASGQPSSYYFWEDNPFISGEPYDRLSGPVSTGTAKVTITVKSVVYEDGTLESY